MPRVQVSMFGAKFKLKGRFYAHFVVTDTRVEFWRLVLALRSLWLWLLTWWEFFRLVVYRNHCQMGKCLYSSLVVYHIRDVVYSVEGETTQSSALLYVTRYSVTQLWKN